MKPVYKLLQSKCGRCVNKDTDKCDNCIDHPKWQDRPTQSYFELYRRTCPHGYRDCIYDPAYIKFWYPDWYKDLYGDKTPQEVVRESCNDCEDGDRYDDEDK